MSSEVIIDDFTFVGHMRPPLIGSPDSGVWRRAITGAAPPTVQTADLGLMNLALTNANEVQNACLYMGDVLSYDIDDLIQVDFWVALTAAFAAANTFSFGLASSRSDTVESMNVLALFKCLGNNNLLLSTDDNVVDTSDIATGETLSTTIKRFVMDFGSGLNTVAAGLSTGGKSNVKFLADNGRGQLRNLAPNQRFDMSNYGGGVQLFAQIQKTVGASTGTGSIQRIRVKRRQP